MRCNRAQGKAEFSFWPTLSRSPVCLFFDDKFRECHNSPVLFSPSLERHWGPWIITDTRPQWEHPESQRTHRRNKMFPFTIRSPTRTACTQDFSPSQGSTLTLFWVLLMKCAPGRAELLCAGVAERERVASQKQYYVSEWLALACVCLACKSCLS